MSSERSEDGVRDLLMRVLYVCVGVDGSWQGEGKRASFDVAGQSLGGVCEAEGSLKYVLPKGGSLSHKTDILITARDGRVGASRTGKENYPSMNERSVIRRLFVQRVAAQSMLGGPAQYKFLRGNVPAIDELVDHHPDLFSIISLAVFIEHPELLGPGAPDDAFDVLRETLQGILNAEVPGWKTQGVWDSKMLICSLCQTRITCPDPALMTAAIRGDGETDFLCEKCAPPLAVRAMSALGFFSGRC